MKIKQSVQSADFVRPFSESKRKAYDGPILVTSHGSPGFVFMTLADFEELVKKSKQ